MKKISIILLLCFIAILYAKADKIEFNYQFEKPILSKNGEFVEVQYENCSNYGPEGNPSMPFFPVDLLLPQGHEVQDIQVVNISYYPTGENIKINPAERQFPLSQKPNEPYIVKPNKKTYALESNYPQNIVDGISTQFLSGHSIGGFTICPVRYIPAHNKANFIKSITVEVHTKKTNKAASSKKHLKLSPSIKTRIEKIVENPGFLKEYKYGASSKTSETDILIITNEDLLPGFNTYIDYKTGCGFIIETITTTEIYNQYTGVDNPEKIRNCIIDFYQNKNLEFVILGGDADGNGNNIVPARYLTVDAYNTPDVLPGDMYYSCLDGDWDTDGDGNYGEPGEEDILAEVHVGRLCVDDQSELNNFIQKLIAYQDTPVLDDIEKALMVGELLWNDPTYGGDYKDEVAYGSSSHGYTTTGISNNFTIETLYDRDGGWSVNDIYSQFNNTGINLLNHLGHSNVDYNMTMYNSSLTTSNFQNDGVSRGYVIEYSQGCYCGSFDNRDSYGSYGSEDCFAEKFTTLETGLVATIMNSRYGWGQHNSTDGASQYFDREFFDAIFGENITAIGIANDKSKEDNIGNLSSHQGAIRWCAYQLNLFGDPSMDIWTAQPNNITATFPQGVSIGASQIDFTTDAPNARVALIQNNTLIGRGITDGNGLVTISLFDPLTSAEPVSVSIIGHNKNRYNGTINVFSDTPYIVYEAFTINDENYNNNQQADYGEEIMLSLEVTNVGNQPANGVDVTLSSADDYITFTDNQEFYGDFQAQESKIIDNGFSLEISQQVPDMHKPQITIEATDGDSIWYSTFTIDICAPVIKMKMASVDNGDAAIFTSTPLVNAIENEEYNYFITIEETGGNGNGRLDPGETTNLKVNAFNNGHAYIGEGIGNLSSESQFVTINNSSASIPLLLADSSAIMDYSITIDEDTEIGSTVDFELILEFNEFYIDTLNLALKVGLIVEDFETGDFSSYPWAFGGDADWIIDAGQSYEGLKSAVSDDIDDSQSSALEITLDVTTDDSISFYKKVSTEQGWDYFSFYIDNNLQDEWSGEIDWSNEQYAVTAGTHTFKWKYEKDSYVTSGSDCAWLDYIILPPNTSVKESNKNVSISAPTLPSWLTLQDHNDGTADLTGTPGGNNGGDNAVVIEAETGNGTISQSFTIYVSLESIKEHSSDVIIIGPNPANNFLNIISEKTKISNITLYDMKGKKIITEKPGEHNFKLDLSALSKGTYIIRIVSGEEMITKKVQIVK